MSECEFQCEFCLSKFANRANLLYHQKNAKFCLKKRGVEIGEDYKCPHCDKKFNVKFTLKTHSKTCKELLKKIKNKKYTKTKGEIEIEKEDLELKIRRIEREKEKLETELKTKDQYLDEYKNMVSQLQKTITDIASRPTYSTSSSIKNTNIQNTLNLNDTDRIKSILEKDLQAEAICEGQRSLAKFVVEKILTDDDGKLLYKCVDSARQNFQYINEYGFPEKDVKACKLSNALVKSDLKTVVFRDGDRLWMVDGIVDNDRMSFFQDKIIEISNLESDNSKFALEMAKLTS